MDTKVVEVRKNFLVSTLLNNNSSWTQHIKIDFIPDEMIVKAIFYTPPADDPGATVIYSDIVSDYIGSFSQNVSITQNLTFTLKRTIDSVFKFTIMPSALQPPPDPIARSGDIFIHLEFVKYREVKEQKIL